MVRTLNTSFLSVRRTSFSNLGHTRAFDELYLVQSADEGVKVFPLIIIEECEGVYVFNGKECPAKEFYGGWEGSLSIIFHYLVVEA